MINDLTFPEEIRPDQALAALRIGFLFRRAEHESATIWKGSLLKIPDIEETFEELDGDLLALSNRFNDYEARKVSELRNQMANASSAAFHIRMDLLFTTPPHLRDQMLQQIENDPAVQRLKKLQISRLDDLRRILLNIVGNDLRLPVCTPRLWRKHSEPSLGSSNVRKATGWPWNRQPVCSSSSHPAIPSTGPNISRT